MATIMIAHIGKRTTRSPGVHVRIIAALMSMPGISGIGAAATGMLRTCLNRNTQASAVSKTSAATTILRSRFNRTSVIVLDMVQRLDRR